MTRTPNVPRVLLVAPSLLCAVREGAMTGVPEGLPTPWGTGGRGEPPLGVCAGVVMDAAGNGAEVKAGGDETG